ncbi:MAG TPA: c-type cytochrome [Pyrinomonadaceae bacterium]|nr:c-type cytochrome [Pyrinomonadaceae bacterium]
MRKFLRAAGRAEPIIFCALASLLFLFTSCDREAERAAAGMTGGDPARGMAAISRYGCATCHTVPGVSGANGLVGPPLGQVASRVYLAGRLQNTLDNMIQWIRNPQGVDEKTAMPNLGVTDTDARDITSYLYTLK